jgi:hypothetical protein
MISCIPAKGQLVLTHSLTLQMEQEAQYSSHVEDLHMDKESGTKGLPQRSSTPPPFHGQKRRRTTLPPNPATRTSTHTTHTTASDPTHNLLQTMRKAEQTKQVVSEPPAPTTPVCQSENSLLREDDPRMRGAAIDEGGGGMEELVSSLVDLGFMEGQGLRQPEDGAAAEEEEEPQAGGSRWSNERLDQPLHQHADMAVKDLVWFLMDVCKDTVKGKPLDKIIKILKRSMPKDNCMPGCAQCPEHSV